MGEYSKSVLETIKKYRLIQSGDKVLVLVSGGPDSMSLLYFLLQNMERLNIDVAILHINHRLRGKQSDDDQAFVEKFASEKGLNIRVDVIDTLEYCRQNKLSLEDGARKVRYEKAEIAARRLEATKIATAHNADDNAENFIMRSLRGSGLAGLSGIPPVRGNIIRPLIETFRSEILSYCARENINYRIDKTNLEPVFFRNKVRLNVVPQLDQLFSAWKSNLLKTTGTIRDDLDFLNQTAGKELKEMLIEQNEGLIALQIKKINMLHISIRRLVLRAAIEIIAGDLKQIEFKHTEFIIEKIEAKDNFSINLPGDLISLREYDKLIFKREEQRHQVEQTKLALGISTYLPEIGLSIKSEIMSNNELEYAGNIANLDASKIDGPIFLRSVRPGDRFNPLGLKGSKKISDYFIDKKIPRRIREKALVVCDKSKIIWLIGFEISELAKVEKNTDKVLILRSESIEVE